MKELLGMSAYLLVQIPNWESEILCATLGKSESGLGPKLSRWSRSDQKFRTDKPNRLLGDHRTVVNQGLHILHHEAGKAHDAIQTLI
jgi:hypothetical protein